MQTKRVVITGMEVFTPLGQSLAENWVNLLGRGSNYTKIKETGNPALQSYEGDEYVSYIQLEPDFIKKWASPFVRTKSCALAHKTVNDLLISSGITKEYLSDNAERIGSSMASLSSNLSFLVENVEKGAVNGYQGINRMTMMNVLNNIVQSTLNVKYGLKGPMLCPSTACSAGLSAIGEAYNTIQLGYSDMMIVGGVEEAETLLDFYGPKRLGALSTKSINGKICCPFDKDRNGIVLGEGAGFLILETLDSALARQAKILCEIKGFGMSGDGYHLVKPQESGEGNLRAMLMAVDRSGLKPKEIIEEGLFVNAHATSTVVGDKAELIGIEKLINHLSQKQVDKVRAISFKANIGHCFSAAGIIESILGIHSLNTETIPKNLFFDGCEVEQNTVEFSKTQTTFKGRYMLKNSFGFGGVNTSMLISK